MNINSQSAPAANMLKWILISSIIVINLRLEAIMAINCVLCESAYAAHCGADFELEAPFRFDCGRVPPPRYLENDITSPNATACMKKIYIESESGVEKIVRSCFFGDVNDTSVGCKTDPALTAAIQDVSCHVCDNANYCNAASLVSSGGCSAQCLLLALTLMLLLASPTDVSAALEPN